MRTIFVFTGAYILSLFVALAIGVQLAIYFRSQDEFIAVLMALIIFSLLAIIVFALTYRLANGARTFGYMALALGVAAIVIEELPALAEAFATRSTNPYMVGSAQDLAIAIEMLVPAFAMLLIQWRLLRRHWLAARGLEHRAPWPWITIVAATLLLCNPVAFDIMSSAIRQAPDDMLASFWLKVTIAVAALLISGGMMEWNTRRRRLARHAAAQPPAITPD